MNAIIDVTILIVLLEWVFKSSLLLIAAIGLARFLEPRSSAAVRHLLMRSSITGSLVLAIIGPLAPVWQLSQSSLLPAFLPQLTASVQAGGAIETAGISWVLIALSIWGVGILALASRYVSGIVLMFRISRDSFTLTDSVILRIASEIESDLAITRQVRYKTSHRVSVPLAWGVLRPVVILPANCRHTDVEAAMLLRHELAHVRRHDVLWLNITTILTLFQWFNPLMWIVKRKMQIESEHACDNYVLNGHIEPDSYARHILEAARSVSFKGTLISTHMAFNSHLEGRIMSILNNHNRGYLTGSRLNFWIATALLFGCLTLAGFTLESCSTVSDSESAASLSGAEQAATSPDTLVEVDTFPEMTFQHTPVYPESAKKAGTEGTVWVKAFVGQDGAVSEAIAAKSSGDTDLDNAAVASALNNRFKPATQDGKPVSVWVTYKVEFALSDKKDAEI